MIIHGECIAEMARLEADSIDACVTDPPYHLTSVVKRFGKKDSAPAKHGTDGLYARQSAGFMGKVWDGGDIAMRPEVWEAVYRVLKPGGHLLAFGGTRTHHRVWCAIEDAGFEIRDTVMWVYGSGFPKSHDAGNGWGTALKPAWEPIVVARKPLIGTVAENVLKHGTGAINIDGCRVEGVVEGPGSTPKSSVEGQRGSMAGAMERIEYDGSKGRWPANLIHDGSEEVLEAFPQAKGQAGAVGPQHGAKESVNTFGDYDPREQFEPRLDSGSAARFFYCAKASKSDREAGNKHPTVKPTDLMRYLCRLVTPPNGLILDPFMGSGSTGKAALLEGFRFVGIEREAEYVTIARARLGLPAEKQTSWRKLANHLKEQRNV